MKHRVVTYSNFISRIIYDMKWYDQDINTIVNPIFRTDINAVIDFVVKNVFPEDLQQERDVRIPDDSDPVAAPCARE